MVSVPFVSSTHVILSPQVPDFSVTRTPPSRVSSAYAVIAAGPHRNAVNIHSPVRTEIILFIFLSSFRTSLYNCIPKLLFIYEIITFIIM